jgi:hypothetical protein
MSQTLLGTCGICDEPIWLDLPAGADGLPQALLEQEAVVAAEAHLRTHPAPEAARFWLRRFLEDIRPSERAEAVRRIYTDLRDLWGDQDSRGAYGVEEVLRSPSMYRLWLDARRCGYAGCNHHDQPSAAEPASGEAQPIAWHGTDAEWRDLQLAAARHCRCAVDSTPCPVHQLLADPASCKRLLFARRLASRLKRDEGVPCFAPC